MLSRNNSSEKTMPYEESLAECMRDASLKRKRHATRCKRLFATITDAKKTEDAIDRTQSSMCISGSTGTIPVDKALVQAILHSRQNTAEIYTALPNVAYRPGICFCGTNCLNWNTSCVVVEYFQFPSLCAMDSGWDKYKTVKVCRDCLNHLDKHVLIEYFQENHNQLHRGKVHFNQYMVPVNVRKYYNRLRKNPALVYDSEDDSSSSSSSSSTSSSSLIATEPPPRKKKKQQ